MFDETETPYRKSTKKPTPQKADHPHEYVTIFAMSPIRRFNGTISKEKYKFSMKPTCIRCGHTVPRRKSSLEVEVTPQEYARIKQEGLIK